jgi:hypothetical protein
MFRRMSGNRKYIISTRRMTKADELNYRNGLTGFRRRGMLQI